MSPSELQPGTSSPAGSSVALAVAPSGSVRVAYWSQNQRDAIDTLYVGDPLGSREVAVTGTAWLNEAGLALGVASAGATEVPHVLAVRWNPASARSADGNSAPRELVYATRRGSMWSYEVLETAWSRGNCTLPPTSDETCQIDELNVWPVSVITRGSDVRLFYTSKRA